MKKRFNCPRCLRPCSHCFCPLVQPVACGVELLILQHPLEHGHAKNTARLLHLCLPGSRLEVGECFAPAQLAQWLAAADKRSVLLYPPSAPDRNCHCTRPRPCLRCGCRPLSCSSCVWSCLMAHGAKAARCST